MRKMGSVPINHTEAVEAAAARLLACPKNAAAERIARAQEALLAAIAADPLRAALEFDDDPVGYLLALQKCK